MGVQSYNMAEKDAYTVYRLNGITYLPHYSEKYYVGPGFGLFNNRGYLVSELIANGAKPYNEYLFKRGYLHAAK